MIISKKNDEIIFLKKLNDKKYRTEFGVFLITGKKLFNEAIKQKYELVKLYITENYIEQYNDYIDKVEIVSENIIEYLSELNNPEGIIATFKYKNDVQIDFNDDFVVLDNIQDPYNVGAILRCCRGVGINNVVLISSADPYCEKCLRGSMGSSLGINKIICNMEEFIDIINSKNINNLYAADLDGVNIFEMKKPSSFGLIIGNEGNGISKEIIPYINNKIYIPMQNNLESLNASVSAGIILYELKHGKQ